MTDSKEPLLHLFNVGEKVRLTRDIYDYGEDAAYPPGYIARKGEIVVVRDCWLSGKGGLRIEVSHGSVIDRSFVVYTSEIEELT